MKDIIQGAEAIRLLEAHGFYRVLSEGSAGNSLAKQLYFKKEDRSDLVRVEVQDAWERDLPRNGSRRYRVVARHASDGVKAVVFCSSNCADVLAFATAVTNDLRTEYGEEVPETDCFDLDGTAIHNPFADEQYGDWRLVERPGDNEIHVAHPAEAYGDAYCRWRDELVEVTLKEEAPTP